MNLMEVSPHDYHTKLTCDRSNVLSPDSWLSKSVIWQLSQTSLFAWRYHPKSFKPTDSMRWGTLIDALTTTPELVDDLIAVSPFESFRTKEARSWRDEQIAAGIGICTQAEYDEAQRAAEMLLEANKASAEIFSKSNSQVIVGAKIAGTQVKGLLDLAPVGESYLADLKTTNDFSLDGFAKTTATFGYHMQGGLYVALWNACHPDDKRDSFRLVWQSSAPPYEVVVTEMSQDDLERGYEYAEHLIERIVAATKANHWPMLGEGSIPVLTRPAWAGIQEEAKIDADREQPIEAPAVEMEEVA